ASAAATPMASRTADRRGNCNARLTTQRFPGQCRVAPLARVPVPQGSYRAPPCAGAAFPRGALAPMVNEARTDMVNGRVIGLVVRFRSSPALAARPDASFGIEDH